jgi:hypothetical protein
MKMKQSLVVITLIALILTGCENQSSKRIPGQPYTEFVGENGNGVKRIYNAQGKLETEVQFKDSLPNGIQKEYYKTGQLFRETPFEMGKANGLVKEYYTSGKLYREMPVLNGRANGIVKKYYENGVLLSEAPFENGQPTIGLIEYSENGKPLEKPKMLFKGIDNTEQDGIYIIQVSFSDKYIEPTYYQVINYEGKESTNKLSMENGKGILRVSIPKGSILNRDFIFEARYNTLRKNTYITRGSFNMALNN